MRNVLVLVREARFYVTETKTTTFVREEVFNTDPGLGTGSLAGIQVFYPGTTAETAADNFAELRMWMRQEHNVHYSVFSTVCQVWPGYTNYMFDSIHTCEKMFSSFSDFRSSDQNHVAATCWHRSQVGNMLHVELHDLQWALCMVSKYLSPKYVRDFNWFQSEHQTAGDYATWYTRINRISHSWIVHVVLGGIPIDCSCLCHSMPQVRRGLRRKSRV